MVPSSTDIDRFASWVEDLMRDRGYDIDSPRGGGKSKLAEDAGVHRAAVTRLLQRQSMPDLDTMRGLAHALRVPIREVLIRSGKLTAEDLPQAVSYPAEDSASAGTGGARMTLEQVAEALGIPDDRREMFIKVAQQFTPDQSAVADRPSQGEGTGRKVTRRLAAG
ncbi:MULTISPECIES: helix-turn-helix transcriptional regulator [unclassified Kitasatospora]|uniref:helix-turn-helix domain-containing protein n=1 Tax=unclassified Kitasatospora TaxID=2633591 RepID=UPI00070F2BAD|nr:MULTISPECIES: helix-turn-helix transcriptional regulator [unclassified Kitasatospora]KQV18655.1 DNA-binding protein [Kitasatospora sp. Root107]KRB74637.1 DNA-binding protein [Kitasatospora sp. Root187]